MFYCERAVCKLVWCTGRSEGERSVFSENLTLQSGTVRSGFMECCVVRGRFVNWFGEQEGARVNGVFLVRTLHFRAERLDVAIWNVVL
jgi:hypothetical protein